MKKSLIALAALATVGAAQAQSSVTVYGVIDAGYSDTSRTTNGTTKAEQQAFSLSNYTSSRLGFRGTEDLGGGMRASFIAEAGIYGHQMQKYGQSSSTSNGADMISGSANMFTGTRELGLALQLPSNTTISAGFGSTALRRIVLGFDPAGGTNLVGNYLTVDGGFSSSRGTGAGISQKFGDFEVGATLTQNTTGASGANDEKTSNGVILNLAYAKGPLAFAAARQDSKSTRNATTATTTGGLANATTCPTDTATVDYTCGATDSYVLGIGGALTGYKTVSAVTTTAGQDTKTTRDIIAASYDLGVAKLFVQHGRTKVDDSVTVNSVAAASAGSLITGDGKRQVTTIGATVPVGKVTLWGLVSEGSEQMVTAANTPAVKRDVSGYNVGARYALSKRTFGYAAVGQTKLDGISGNTGAVKVEQTTVGLVHNF